jgi:hypothetical protein
VAALGSLRPAAAQTYYGGAQPLGSYLNSCTDMKYDSGVIAKNLPQELVGTVALYGYCDALPDIVDSGFLGLNTTVNADTCRATGPHYGICNNYLFTQYCQPNADIANINGNLNCIAKTGTWGWGGAIPGGDYLNSCLNVHVLNGNLGADCPDYNGNYHHTVIEPLTKCAMWSSPGGGIDNVNGVLLCSPNPNPPLPNAAPAPAPPPAPTPAPALTAFQKGVASSLFAQLTKLGCTRQILTENCPNAKGYDLCESTVKAHTLIGVTTCTAQGDVVQVAASADKLVVGAGCTRLLGVMGNYLCPVTGGALALCNSLLSKGNVAHCSANRADAGFVAADAKLLKSGCVYLLGRTGQYMCPASAMPACNGFLKAGTVLSCKGDGK